jgi:hypothetical protein
MAENGRGSGGALPIVAIVAGALVGVVSPVAVAVVARRTKRELDASAERQRRALDAEHQRLEATLDHEGTRQRRETERTLLDHGTVLISDFRDAVADLTLDARGRPVASDRWRRAVHVLVAFRGRLLLWFEESSEIVSAFDGVTVFTAWGTTWACENRAGERKVRLTRAAPGANGGERSLEDVDVVHLRYVVAARAYLADQLVMRPR